MSALWTSDEVARALSPVAMSGAFEASGVTFDSRAVGKGDLFFAMTGETTDGHGFVADALSRGAAAAIVSRDVPEAKGNLVKVADTMKALVDLGHAGRTRSDARVASVTGSVGKTSTKDALRAMLSAQAPTSASTASFNNHVGVPISLARLPRDARYGVFEIGMNHPGEIEPLARQVEAHVGVITNVGPAHIGYMGSEEAIADEKACLFAGMRAGAVAVLNRDSRHYPRLVERAKGFGVSRIVAFGKDAAADARLVACDLQDTGSDVVANLHGRRIEYRLGAAGEHQVLNSLAALAVVEALGADVLKAASDARRGQGHARAWRAAAAEIRRRHDRAARRELQRKSGVDGRDARRAGAHRARVGRAAVAGDGRHARTGRGRGRVPRRSRRCRRRKRCGAGLPLWPAHEGAVVEARGGTEGRLWRRIPPPLRVMSRRR